MSFLRRLPGTRTVTVISGAGTPSEKRVAVQANIQTKHGFFGLDAPVKAGDIVEELDPRAGMPPIRRSVRHVEVIPGPPRSLAHIEVTWGDPPPPERPKPAPLSIPGLHERIQAASSALLEDGHEEQAVFESLKTVEMRIRELSGVDESGTRLVGKVFGGEKPMFRLSRRSGRSGEDEHEGRRLILTGALTSVRNLGAHEAPEHTRQSALELLGLASQMMRWLDEAQASP
jgi:uncharacterized protein (TIGR02391 family)